MPQWQAHRRGSTDQAVHWGPSPKLNEKKLRLDLLSQKLQVDDKSSTTTKAEFKQIKSSLTCRGEDSLAEQQSKDIMLVSESSLRRRWKTWNASGEASVQLQASGPMSNLQLHSRENKHCTTQWPSWFHTVAWPCTLWHDSSYWDFVQHIQLSSC